MLRFAYPRSSEGPSPETRRRRSGEWRPAAAARNRLAPGGSGPRPPGITTWLRGARCTDPEEMPEKEARPPTQNRHGEAISRAPWTLGGVQAATDCKTEISLFGAPWRSVLLYSAVRELSGTPK